MQAPFNEHTALVRLLTSAPSPSPTHVHWQVPQRPHLAKASCNHLNRQRRGRLATRAEGSEDSGKGAGSGSAPPQLQRPTLQRPAPRPAPTPGPAATPSNNNNNSKNQNQPRAQQQQSRDTRPGNQQRNWNQAQNGQQNGQQLHQNGKPQNQQQQRNVNVTQQQHQGNGKPGQENGQGNPIVIGISAVASVRLPDTKMLMLGQFKGAACSCSPGAPILCSNHCLQSDAESTRSMAWAAGPAASPELHPA